MKSKLLSLCVILLLFPIASLAQVDDRDHDGLSDKFEQAALLHFAPVFMVSAAECDGLPAEFALDEPRMRVIARNGTIYGQVFKAHSEIEIHYYHLWSRDCGRLGHRFDVEHVSVLAHANAMQPEQEWKALYWYAAAHEDTLCSRSTVARADALDTEANHPAVWVSAGKHGSFLSVQKCRFGCGGDRCDLASPMVISSIVNIGEPGMPVNGALWTSSPDWSLFGKMTTDFPDTVLARADRATGIVSAEVEVPPTREVLLGGNSTIGAVGKSLSATGNSLLLSSRKVGRFLHLN